MRPTFYSGTRHFRTSICIFKMATMKLCAKLFCPSLTTVRHMSRVNIQRPRVPHFDRLRVLETMKPMFLPPPPEPCERVLSAGTDRELTIFEGLLGKQLLEFLDQHGLVAFYHANSVSMRSEVNVKKHLFRNQMFMKVYNRFIVRKTLSGTKYEALLPLYCSHTKIVFSKEPNVGALLKLQKKMQEYILLAAIVEDRLMSKKDLEWYGSLPTLDLLRGQLLATCNASIMQTVNHLNHHQLQLMQSLNTLTKPTDQDSTEKS